MFVGFGVRFRLKSFALRVGFRVWGETTKVVPSTVP